MICCHVIKQFAFTWQRELILIADEDCAIQLKTSLTNFSDLVTRYLFVYINVFKWGYVPATARSYEETQE